MAKKHILDVEEAFWKSVKLFQLENDIPNINDALIVLIRRGLDLSDLYKRESERMSQVKK